MISNKNLFKLKFTHVSYIFGLFIKVIFLSAYLSHIVFAGCCYRTTLFKIVFRTEDERSDSEEGGKKKFNSRLAKPQSPAMLPQNPVGLIKSPSHLPQIPALPLQPIIPQPKTLVRNRTSKRRSRTNRPQI